MSFGSATYSAAEGFKVSVTVGLSAAPGRAVVIPITTTNQGGASSDRLFGGPGQRDLQQPRDHEDHHVHRRGSTTVDDATEIGESVRLAFGSSLPEGVTAGTQATTVISINDVSVSFGSATYSAAEGSTVAVTVGLSAVLERTVVIPITDNRPGRRHQRRLFTVPGQL